MGAHALRWLGGLLALLALLSVGCTEALEGTSPDGGEQTITTPPPPTSEQVCQETAQCALQCALQDPRCHQRCTGRLNPTQRSAATALLQCGLRQQCKNLSCIQFQCRDAWEQCGQRLTPTEPQSSIDAGPDLPPAPEIPSCLSNADCTSPAQCIEGSCQIPPPISSQPCKRDNDCTAPNVYCVMFQCIPITSGQQCTIDTNCDGDGERCLWGRCVTFAGSGTMCEKNDTCANAELCLERRCVDPTNATALPANNTCKRDTDCPILGDRCVSGHCLRLVGSGERCKEHAECNNTAEICIFGRCSTPPALLPMDGRCTDEWDCPIGETCVQQRCQPRQGPQTCQVDFDCNNIHQHCINGVCH